MSDGRTDGRTDATKCIISLASRSINICHKKYQNFYFVYSQKNVHIWSITKLNSSLIMSSIGQRAWTREREALQNKIFLTDQSHAFLWFHRSSQFNRSEVWRASVQNRFTRADLSSIYFRVPARWGLQQTIRAPDSDKTRGQYDGPDVTPFIHTFVCESTVRTTLSSSCFTHMSLCMKDVMSGPS